jgi:hypothetical protein
MVNGELLKKTTIRCSRLTIRYSPFNTHYSPFTIHTHMNLLGIVAVSGKPGLWKALAQNKTGYILESLDAAKTKMVANISTAKIAALDEITIFGIDDDIRLRDVFENIKAGGNVPDAKADGNTLRRFFREVAPDHDEEKVYASDMKKVIIWYNILKVLPLFEEERPGAAPAEEPVAEVTAVAAAIVEEPVTAEVKAAEVTQEAEPTTAKTKKPAAKKV